MAYTKQEWTDNDATTPITGDRLDVIEEGIRTAHVTADAAIPSTQKGAAGGVAPLDAQAKVPAANLPTPPTVVTDHGTLTGLADDDHTQYHTAARATTHLGSLGWVLRTVAASSAATARPTHTGPILWECSYTPFSKPTAAQWGDHILDLSD